MSRSDGFDCEIAVIGMGGRFPQARNLAEYWQNLRDSVEAVSRFSDEELLDAGVDRDTLNDPGYVKAGAVLDDVEMFDAAFFGFSRREAEVMDPQHRLFLEQAWQAMEDAGYNSESYEDRIGVFAGSSANSYLLNHLLTNREVIDSVGQFQASIGNDHDFLATQVSYKLNLKGPSFTVQTACSTSLVAIHLACQSLLNRECDMALAGGVSIRLPQKQGYLYQEGGILSPDGHCRPFDEQAQGTFSGSGVGVVVLKRLQDALAERDTIRAIIKGSAINNDGAQKVGFTAPGVSGQAAVIEEALAMAGMDAESIGYVEAHGTATPLGDPVEVAALTEAFRASTDKRAFCAIGSVKSNIGHLDAAAGVASFIKVVLALENRTLPPSLNFERPNPKIDFENSPFYVNDRLREWNQNPRRAGVSSFGIGGTNVHVIVEEAARAQPSERRRPHQLITLSARTRPALETATTRLAAHLKETANTNLADVAYTLQVGRKAFEHRRAVVASSVEELIGVLQSPGMNRSGIGPPAAEKRSVAFVFSGQGTQYVGMARGLYEVEPTFRSQIDVCSEMLRPHLRLDLRDLLYPDAAKTERAAIELQQTANTQPALFVVEWALAHLLIEWGVRPQAMIGHSIGEYVAACLAGVFSLEDALSLVASRGRLMQQLETGAMLAVPLSEQDVLPLLDANNQLAVAAVNAPALCIVSGPTGAVSGLERRLSGEGLACKRLRTSHAFHSAMMEPILEPFAEQVRKVELRAPRIPYLSNVTGDWITAAEATSPHYWADHLRQTVRFRDGVSRLLEEPDRVLVEVGPGHGLSTALKQYAGNGSEPIAIAAMPRPRQNLSDDAFLLGALGQLWATGVEIDWQKFHAGHDHRRVPLPTYPFERERYWVEPSAHPADGAQEKGLERNPEISRWFYVPSWKRSPLPERPGLEPGDKPCWLVLGDEGLLAGRVIGHLRSRGESVIAVKAASQFARLADDTYSINPRQRDDYVRLLQEIAAMNQTPASILHLWNVSESDAEKPIEEVYDESQYLGFYSLIFLAQAIGEEFMSDPIEICVVSTGLQDVTGAESLNPQKATLLGPAKVITLEYPNINCRSVDVASDPSEAHRARLAHQLVAELQARASDPVVAYRGPHRWVQSFAPVEFAAGIPVDARSRLQDGAVYLLTGGLREIDLSLADSLAATVRAKLVLIAPSGFPQKERWHEWLETHPSEDETSLRINRLLAIESRGAEMLVVCADISSSDQMRSAVARAVERWGSIGGVFHTAEATGGGLVQLKTPEMAESVLAPKVKGALVLGEVLKDVAVDFLALFSSTLAISGVFGQADYCAANAFLDVFARWRSREPQPFTISINWNTPQWEDWQEAAMAAVPDLQEQLRQARQMYGISYQDGFEALSRLLARSEPQVVVATQDFQAIIAQQNAAKGSGLRSLLEGATGAAAPSPVALGTDYVAPTNEIEQVTAELWQRLFGVERVGIHDDFFNLGGNSLLAIQLISQLRKRFAVELPLSELFESPTIAGLAAIIAEGRQKQKELEEIARLLKEVEQLSREEVAAELGQIESAGDEQVS
jgi:acyl transferase domain-containing protein